MTHDVSKLSLREKIGQLFIFGFRGYEPDSEILELIERCGVGGVIYFTRNIVDAKQVHRLSQSLNEAGAKAGRVPMFIAIDQEGGMVARLVKGITLTPGNMALGATGNAEAAGDTARISGEQLRLVGLNLNFAPVVDVNNNPDNPVINVRSYGDNAELVSEFGLAAVRGYQQAGVSATVKHFPGHGDTNVDSHHALAMLPHDRARLEEIELVPFRRTADDADFVMTAHVGLPALDPSGVPSTLSKPILTGLLREDIGYEGIIITDCLEMDAIDKNYGPGKASVMALQAGADMVLVSHTPAKHREALAAVEAAVASGELSEARIDESVSRILAAKVRRGLYEPLKPWAEIEASLDTPEQRRSVEKWSEASVTLVKNEGGLLPLRKEAKTLVLWPEIVAVSVADEMLSEDGTLGARLAHRLADVTERKVTDPDALEGLEQFEQVVFVSYDAAKFPAERAMAAKLGKQAQDRTVAVSVRNPLDLLLFPDVKAFLAVYECRPLALEAAAKALTGELSPVGRLPLRISEQYPLGWRWQ